MPSYEYLECIRLTGTGLNDKRASVAMAIAACITKKPMRDAERAFHDDALFTRLEQSRSTHISAIDVEPVMDEAHKILNFRKGLGRRPIFFRGIVLFTDRVRGTQHGRTTMRDLDKGCLAALKVV